MSGAVKRQTTNFALNIINYDFPRWHTFEWQNWDVIDAVLAAAGLTSVRGVWAVSTQYVVGDRVIDETDNTIWLCNVNHTSAASGTFLAARTANPTYWSVIASLPVDRGAWMTGVNYSTQDIVIEDNAYYYCIAAHVSGVFATDLAADRWALIFDLNPALDASADAATSAAAALVSENNASTSETNAAASAADANADAVFAATQANNAFFHASNAVTAATTATTQAGIATTAATNAAASYDSFDDRYLGEKASDPTVDNDGNALLVGALYWRNTAPIGMKVYNGASWDAFGIGEAPADNKQYERRNGVWVLVRERYDAFSANSVTFTAPSGAKRAKVSADLRGDGTDATVHIRLQQTAGVDLSDANYSSYGSYHQYTDTALTPMSVTGQPQALLTNSFGTGALPNLLDIDVPLIRFATAFAMGGLVRSQVGPAAGSYYLLEGAWVYAGTSHTSFAGFRIFRTAGVWNTGHSFFDVEWSY